MNKTVTINLSGIIFHIEEDAYDTLSKYLNTIKGYFQESDGRDEIMSDIESRIAELLREKTNTVKQVVVMHDVSSVMEVMGKPEDFASEDHQPAQESDNSSQSKRKRAFRDNENRVIAGVCSGFGHYFDIDPLWFRIGYVILFFGSFGFVIPLYIILWIIIPEAKTTAEKLEMKGEKIDINNISKKVKDEVNKVSSRGRDNMGKFLDLLRDILGKVFKIFLNVVGFFMLLFGLGLFVATLILLVNGPFAGSGEGKMFMEALWQEEHGTAWMIFGLSLLIGIPAIMLTYKGIKLLFTIRYRNKWINFGAGILWALGLIISIFIGASVSKEFAEEGRSKTSFPVNHATIDTLYVRMTDEKPDGFRFFDKDEEMFMHSKHWEHNVNGERWMFVEKNGVKQLIGLPRVTIERANGNAIEISIIKRAKGRESKEAFNTAKSIVYAPTQLDSVLTLANYFELGKESKWRDQQVLILVRLPLGKVIHIDKNMLHYLYDVDNITDTWDGDMVGRRWKMTSKGLACIDCEGLELNSKTKTINLTEESDENGINIQSETTQIKVNEEGIKIITEDEKGNKKVKVIEKKDK